MINNIKDLREFLREDRNALRVTFTFKNVIFNNIWKFQRNLRYVEYLTNTNSKFLLYFFKFRLNRLGLKLGFSIPPNVFGKGLSIAHYGTIVVNKNARIGKNCRLHICVNIGADYNQPLFAPHIGDNCYIGPGAKVFGGVKIADNIKIGANAVVNKSFLESDKTLVGVPAREL